MLTPLNKRAKMKSSELTPKEISDKEIHILSCLLQEHSFQAIMKTQSEFIHSATNSDILAICIQQQQKLSMEFLGQEKEQLVKLLKYYRLKPTTINLLEFIKHFQSDLIEQGGNYLEVHSLERIFDGILTNSQYQLFEKEIGFHSAIIYPLHCYQGERIGYAVYFYLNKHQPFKENLPHITHLLETIIQPLYDSSTKTFFSRNQRISDITPELTPTEKRITRKLMNAHSYAAIAEEMNISINTVKTHVKHIFAKFKVSSKMELANKLNHLKI
ncbi:MAG TPA: LuxR family transcriptional regulator [Thiomicrospira sp.]|nr:LuxR family transcriptional regulator [Thiomicrospira sp.]